MENIQFSFEANLLPDNHIVNQRIQRLSRQVWEEGNLIVVGVKDDAFHAESICSWNKLMTEIKAQKKST
jgi:CRISPR/Cas system-associated protein endoribonuclease Cas2